MAIPIKMRRRGIPIRYRKYRAHGTISSSRFVIILISLVFLLGFAYNLGAGSVHKEAFQVVNVLDGDTIIVKNSQNKEITVRMLGIDTPEVHHPTKPVQCFGPEASAFTKELLTERIVKLEYDVERYDKYSRTLAYVYLNNQRVNDLLISKGLARLLIIKPNAKYAHTLLEEEVSAKNNHVGLWKYCQ